MSLAQRLRKLEAASARRSSGPVHRNPEPPVRVYFTEEEWLAQWEACAQQGCFANEQDFLVALAEFRHCLEKAKAQAAPPFDPPRDFLPNLEQSARQRQWRWQFQEVQRAFVRVLEIFGRILEDQDLAQRTTGQGLEPMVGAGGDHD
jgi:hypothetical protein